MPVHRWFLLAQLLSTTGCAERARQKSAGATAEDTYATVLLQTDLMRDSTAGNIDTTSAGPHFVAHHAAVWSTLATVASVGVALVLPSLFSSNKKQAKAADGAHVDTREEREPVGLHLPYIIVMVENASMAYMIPLAPFLFENIAGGSMYYGILTGSYSLAMLVGSPLVGRFSDKFGRKNIILLGLAGSFLAYFLMGVGIYTNMWILITARFLGGISGSTTAVVEAYIADLTTGEQRTKARGYMAAFDAIGCLVGPIVAVTLCARFGIQAALFLPSSFLVILIFVCLVSLEESTPIQRPAGTAANKSSNKIQYGKSALIGASFAAFFVVFADTWAQAGGELIFPFMCVDFLGCNQGSILIMFLFGVIGIALGALAFIPICASFMGDVALILAGSFLCALMNLLIANGAVAAWRSMLSCVVSLGIGRVFLETGVFVSLTRLADCADMKEGQECDKSHIVKTPNQKVRYGTWLGFRASVRCLSFGATSIVTSAIYNDSAWNAMYSISLSSAVAGFGGLLIPWCLGPAWLFRSQDSAK